MQPFNFFGQDSGSLIYYYSGVIRSNTSLPYDYLILKNESGFGLISLPADSYRPRTTAVIGENFSYQVLFNGDFFGLFEENFYNAEIANGAVLEAYSDSVSLRSEISGLTSGVLLDIPQIKLQISGEIQSGLIDIPFYDSKIKDGQISGVLIDLPRYSISLSGEKIQGILLDLINHKVNFNGKIDKIYRENINLNILFTGGKIYNDGTLLKQDNQETLNLSFSFINGAFYQE